MDPFDKLASDIAAARSPFALGNEWPDIQQGFAALAAWKKDVEARLKKLEAPSRLPQN